MEGYDPSTWVAFDRVLVVKDIYIGGVRTFLNRQDAHLYRKMLYAQVGTAPAATPSPLPGSAGRAARRTPALAVVPPRMVGQEAGAPPQSIARRFCWCPPRLLPTCLPRPCPTRGSTACRPPSCASRCPVQSRSSANAPTGAWLTSQSCWTCCANLARWAACGAGPVLASCARVLPRAPPPPHLFAVPPRLVRPMCQPALLASLHRASPHRCRSSQVHVVEFNASTPFREQLEIMASTTVLVSVHTSNLANSQFMQPGSAVFEIIQRNWFWHGLDKSFQVGCGWAVGDCVCASSNAGGWRVRVCGARARGFSGGRQLGGRSTFPPPAATPVPPLRLPLPPCRACRRPVRALRTDTASTGYSQLHARTRPPNLPHSRSTPPTPAPRWLAQVQTAVMGDIHHYALRCRHANETVYIVERDRHRFGDWEPLQCNTEECVEVSGAGWGLGDLHCQACCLEPAVHVLRCWQPGVRACAVFAADAVPPRPSCSHRCPSPAVAHYLPVPATFPPQQAHTNVDVRVDIPAFRALLADRLPLVYAGWPVEAAAIPWPVQEGAD